MSEATARQADIYNTVLAMSQQNVEIVRRGYERFNDGDIDGFLEFCAPDLEFRDLPDLPGSRVFIGHGAVRGWWSQPHDAFENLRFDAEEFFIDAGDRVLVPTHGTGCGPAAVLPVELHFSTLWALRHGKGRTSLRSPTAITPRRVPAAGLRGTPLRPLVSHLIGGAPPRGPPCSVRQDLVLRLETCASTETDDCPRERTSSERVVDRSATRASPGRSTSVTSGARDEWTSSVVQVGTGGGRRPRTWRLCCCDTNLSVHRRRARLVSWRPGADLSPVWRLAWLSEVFDRASAAAAGEEAERPTSQHQDPILEAN